MSIELFGALLLFALIASITPGPNNLMLMASGANYGFRKTMPHLLGVVLGFAVMVLLVGFGLMNLFSAFPLMYLLLKTASVIYLAYLAWKIATAAAPDTDEQTDGKPLTFLQAAIFQWVNPKAWAMALTALSAYTPPSLPFVAVLFVSSAFLLTNVPSQLIWVMLGTQLRKWLSNSLKLRVFNAVIAALLLLSVYPIVFSN